MSNNPRVPVELEQFSGCSAVFPLPNGVFFPGILFPLHIFEPRYRRMTAEALDGDRMIAMALLKPGWETLKDDSAAPIHSMVCLSQITAEERLKDGRYYLVLRGLSRARISAERTTDLPYRMADLKLCEDDYGGLSNAEDQTIRETLLRGVQSVHPEIAVNPMFVKALDPELPLGVFCDVLAYSLGLPPAQSQRVLEEQNVLKRSRLVIEAMQGLVERQACAPHHFPPKFSRN